jgi:DNA-binding transcriptional LysR family regulator
VELRQLRYFVTVAEELHFGRAADRLGVVQPAVSQQLMRLERELGVNLLRRNSRRVSLTAEGARLLDLARGVLTSVDRVHEAADDLARGNAGVLRLGTIPGLGDRLPRALAVLGEIAPRIDLVLVDGTSSAHAVAVAEGKLTAALVRGEFEAPGVRARLLGEQAHSAVVPAGHPAAAGEVVRVEQLADLRLRLPPRTTDPALRDALHTRAKGGGVVLRLGRDVTSIEDVVLEIGASASMWTVLPDSLLDRVPRSQRHGVRAVVVRPLDPPLRLPVRLLVPDVDDSLGVRLLADAFG